ncbi:hypothetical protein E6O75_ATG05425 [Venturia nashicola]|uniref:Chromo domain-containing protein n=1 Tax=Venturia nashicola TaxID=86259 RepID=A0A4Z1P814_9PEZI|nr:hypothetical protein E6O75_ATG05425 [Venturia nashicola]
MPPPLVEDGDSSADEIPYKDTTENGADVADDASADDDDEGEAEPDEYVVEKILKHDFNEDGTLLFEVKWQGYEEISDRTWEPEENLETASDVLKVYFKKIGGRPANKTPAAKGKKSKKRGAEALAAATPTAKPGRKRSKLSTPPEAATATAVATSARRGKKDDIEDDWKPPHGTWENNVIDIDTIEEVWDEQAGKSLRYAYVMWDNGRKTRHVLSTLNQKCPQKMLHYYESHLSVFRQADSINNGQTAAKAEKDPKTETPRAKPAKMVK